MRAVESKEKEPKRVVGRCYFFRHDKPVYSEELAKLMAGYGYESGTHSSALFGNQEAVDQLAPPFHPSPEQLNKFRARGRTTPFENSVENERVKYEGTIQPPEERKNLAHLVEVLKKDDVIPLVFVGPRTRHGFTAETVTNALAEEGIEIDPKNVTVTDMLTALNKHWVYVLEASKELGLENPWDPILAPQTEHSAKLHEKGLESRDEIVERTRHYLAVLNRMFNMKIAKDPSLKEKSPAAISFTSDFNQMALLEALGVMEIDGVPLSAFKLGVGSYVEVEVLADDTANVYFQPVDASVSKHLATIRDFHTKIR